MPALSVEEKSIQDALAEVQVIGYSEMYVSYSLKRESNQRR